MRRYGVESGKSHKQTNTQTIPRVPRDPIGSNNIKTVPDCVNDGKDQIEVDDYYDYIIETVLNRIRYGNYHIDVDDYDDYIIEIVLNRVRDGKYQVEASSNGMGFMMS